MSADQTPNQYSQPSYRYSPLHQPQAQQPGSQAQDPYTQHPRPASQPNEMAALPPPQSHPQQDTYHHPHNSYDMYQNASQMPYSPPPSQQAQGQPQVGFSQPAPRQRTAIACRYCRRRKIRCHGFDSSLDGRCTNCLRFHQECIFTPVSSQAHAFVPAHTAYPHLRNAGRIQTGPDGRPLYGQGQPGPVLYGAHGQPLGPIGQQQAHDPNYPPPAQGYGSSPYSAQPYEDGRAQAHAPDHQRLGLGARRGSSGAFEYPDPTHMAPVSPASSTTSYSAPFPQAPQAPQPYYNSSQANPRRNSPPSAYPYDARASGSPRGSTSSASSFPPFPAGLHPPQVLPPAFETGRTPPPAGREGPSINNGSRPGMSVRDMLGPAEGGQSTRSTADSDMLKALNRRVM
ncbi:MAG: hypothetical protein LQ340_004816 [Diploschistes diacapsis]|nr:MAG: hypothetical protein LQ340_004816 [Diploschistes diacapsis]